MPTLRDAWQKVQKSLENAPFLVAPREGQAMVTHLCGLAPRDLLARAHTPFPEELAYHLDRLLARRMTGEPLAYVLGHTPFRTHDWQVVTPSGRVLIPRPDTEILIAEALLVMPRAGGRVADIGVGSGCVLGSVLDEAPTARGVGTDISAVALALAAHNLSRLGLAHRTQLVATPFLDGVDGPFDVIVSNPPYLSDADYDALEPQVRDWEPRDALVGGPTGTEPYPLLAAQAHAKLQPGGWLLVEIGATQAVAVEGILRGAGFAAVATRPDLAGRPRVVKGQKI